MMDVTKLSQYNNRCHDEVDRICYPLFKRTPVDVFVYEIYYDSGEAIFLSSAPNVLINWVKNDLHPTQEEFDLYSSIGLKTALLSHLSPLPPVIDQLAQKYEKIIDIASQCDLYHTLFFIDRFTTHYRVCGFGVKKSNKSILNFYLNAATTLQRFIAYFEKNAIELINADNETKLIYLPRYHMIQSINPEIENLAETFLNFDFPLHFDLKNGLMNSSLTSREYQCLSLVAQGHTMKTAAKKLDISHRTVEQHLRNIKDKLGLQTKSQLVELWYANNS